MSNMKCPVCQNNLHKINTFVSTCTNDKCKLWGSSIPNLVLEALAQAKQDLGTARKALEYYADSRFGKKQDDGTYVLEIDKGCGVTVVYTYDPRPAKKALEQITHDNSEKANSVEHKE